MEIRAQLAIVAAVALAWAGGRWVRVRPVVDAAHAAERMSLAALERRVAQRPDDVVSTRVLLRRYLDHGMTRVVLDTAGRSPPAVQRDGAVTLLCARAHEALGDVRAAQASVSAALGRCAVIPAGLSEGAGCDPRTQTELAFEGAALDRMAQWEVTPLTDPARASLAHELATRPVRITAR